MKPEEDIIIEEPIVEEEASSQEKPQEEESTPTLQEAISKQAREDEAPQSTSFTLRQILLGDILNAAIVKKQIWLLLLITMFIIVSISNRFSCQQSMIRINNLQDELKDAKFRSLAVKSQLTEKCRESNVLDMLKNNKDSLLHYPDQPAYIINVTEP